MNNIYCNNPQIIWHPHAAQLLSKYRTFHMPSGTYHAVVAHVNKNHVTMKNIDEYYIVNPSTGETFPMFLLVPCNKCILCQEKKAQSWSFRCLCESYTSKSQAYFITLTYDNDHLPVTGVQPEAIQLFFKRLRIHLDRMNIEHNLRYVAVSEYGHNTHRPHYHIILWNMPETFGTAYTRLKLIENAWRQPTGQYNPDGSPVTKQIGFAYCVPVINGGINYVMKYMKKRCDIPKGKNKTFMLASKKNGGIGSEYATSLLPFYRQNPATPDISVRNIYTNQITTIMLPAYYKQKYFPSESSCYNSDFVRLFKETIQWFNTAEHIYHYCHLETDFKFKYPDEYLSLIRATRKAHYYQRGNTFMKKQFFVYYLSGFVNKEVQKDIYAKAIHIALEYLALAIAHYVPRETMDDEESKRLKPFNDSAIRSRMENKPAINIRQATNQLTQRLYQSYAKEKI
mgnify:FL=1